MTQEQKRAIAIAKAKAAAAKKKGGGQIMRHVNQGIVNAVGGFGDFLNPFDQPHALNPFKDGISVRRGLEGAAEAVGVELGGEAETAWEAAQQGAGEALAAFGPTVKGLQALRMAGGQIGQFADDALRSLQSIAGLTAETAAGATSRGAEEGAENAGAPEWVQQVAAVGAPMGLAAARPAAKLAARGADWATDKLPVSGVVKRQAVDAIGRAKAAIAPYTESGAYEVARQRAQGLAGGKERAARLADNIDPTNEYNLTPAQMTDDPNMRGLEQLARDQDPNLRERLDARAESGRQMAKDDIAAMGGDVAEGQGAMQSRRHDFAQRYRGQAADEKARAQGGSENIRNVRTESENSTAVMGEVGDRLSDALVQEKALWDAVNKDAVAPVRSSRETALKWQAELGRAGEDDMPILARRLLLDDGGYGDAESVRELHRLYSKMREVARNARAGNNRQETLGKVADEIADSILADLGALSGDTPVGRQINAARDYSAKLHATFDRGAVGRLRKRTIDGDTSIDPELALKRTVGRQGAEAAVGSRQLAEATLGRSDPYVTDYIKERFNRAAHPDTKVFNAISARKFIRDNKEILDRYPELRGDIFEAVDAHETADDFAKRVSDRLAWLNNKNKTVGAKFINDSAATVKSILKADNPAKAARQLVNEARKNPDGAALAGVKGAFSRHLISEAGVEDLAAFLSNPKATAALRQIYDPGEMRRLTSIARNMERLSAAGDAANIGTSLSGAKPNKFIDYLVRMVAIENAPSASGVARLQTSARASSLAGGILDRLVSDKASQILMDAVEDPELFRALLTDVQSKAAETRVVPRLIPYLAGASTAQASE